MGPPGRFGRGGHDLTVGPIGKTLILFSLPVMGSNVLQSLNGSVNAIWVSHALGEAALTATTNANNILFLMLGAVFGISMSANLLISQAYGSGDLSIVKKVIGSSSGFFVVMSLFVGVFGYLFTPAILTAMDTPADARNDAIVYLRVTFMAMPFIYIFNFLMMAMRGVGDSRTPFLFSILTVALDVVFNPVLILGWGPFPRMGIAGSATAHLIAQNVTLVAMIIYLYRTKSILVLWPSEWRLFIPELAIIKTLLLKGMPMGLQMLVMSSAAVVMVTFVNRFGSSTAAAYGAAMQLWTYVQMPAMALGAAVSSMAAQNVGAGKLDRVSKIAGVGSMYGALLTAVPVAFIYLVEPYALRLFLPGDSPSLAIAQHMNHIVLWSFIAFGVQFVLSGIVRSTGAVWPPLAMMIFSLWIVRVPFAHFLMPVMGVDAVWWSFPLASLTSASMGFAYYRWGNWRKAKLLDTIPHGSAPDTNLSTPEVADETEAAEDAFRRSNPSEPHRPKSEAPAE
jgi:putative MATE family efflux protein